MSWIEEVAEPAWTAAEAAACAAAESVAVEIGVLSRCDTMCSYTKAIALSEANAMLEWMICELAP